MARRAASRPSSTGIDDSPDDVDPSADGGADDVGEGDAEAPLEPSGLAAGELDAAGGWESPGGLASSEALGSAEGGNVGGTVDGRAVAGGVAVRLSTGRTVNPVMAW